MARRERASLFCARVALDAPARGRSSSSLDGIMVVSPLKLTLAFIATALVAAAAGYVGGTRQLRNATATLFNLSFGHSASNAVLDVLTLRAIHAGDIAKATSMLEDHIDMNLMYLAAYETTVPAQWRDTVVYHDLAVVRACRTEVPSTAASAEVQADIKRALSLRAPAAAQ